MHPDPSSTQAHTTTASPFLPSKDRTNMLRPPLVTLLETARRPPVVVASVYLLPIAAPLPSPLEPFSFQDRRWRASATIPVSLLRRREEDPLRRPLHFLMVLRKSSKLCGSLSGTTCTWVVNLYGAFSSPLSKTSSTKKAVQPAFGSSTFAT